MVLNDVLDYLKSKKGRLDYALPKKWIPVWYDGKRKEMDGKVFVDPYDFYSSVVEKILSEAKQDVDYSKSLSQIRGLETREWIRSANIYAMFVRPTLSYNHKGFGRFEDVDILGYKESGTFLKAIAILLYLKFFGFDSIYLLPISSYSDLFKKGEIGSPYAVKNPKTIDERYADPLLEGFNAEDQFKAFVEAAHILGIRVLIDFIPRTASRDCDLIKEHPEWFYWIKVEELAGYGPPEIPGLSFKIPSEDDLEYIYSLENVREHLKKFTEDPKSMDPVKWENIVKSNPENFLGEIVKEFGVITPPGFSDWINDPQPTWDDVTFLRLYLDHPKAAKKYITDDQPPYVLFDVIKASLFPGEIENEELWDYISSVIPSYQERFGIDGVRLDMGHALPRKLEKMILEKARSYDPSFVFIAEELDVSRDEHAKEAGYDVIIGNSWWMMPRVPDKAYEFYQDIAPSLSLPYLASAETPDTPRIRVRDNGEKLKKLVPFLLAFAPKGIFFINSGQEIGEIQPLNLGLDNTEEGKTVLPPTDEFYAKLGFFDHYAYHWDNPDEDVFGFLKKLIHLREMYINLLTEGEYKPVWLDWQDGRTANSSFWKDGKAIIVLGNLDVHPRSVRVNLKNTKGGDLKVDRVRIWDGKEWHEGDVKEGWVEVSLDSLDFRFVDVSYGEV